MNSLERVATTLQFEVLGKGGGFVLATGCEYPANASLDGARAMVRAAKEICVYKA